MDPTHLRKLAEASGGIFSAGSNDATLNFAAAACNSIIPLLDELERKTKALEFYRDGFTYTPKRTRTGIDLSEWKPSEGLLVDCGNIARAALEGK
jgi:hypothetical protein